MRSTATPATGAFRSKPVCRRSRLAAGMPPNRVWIRPGPLGIEGLWLKDKTTLREVDGEWVEITTPYLDRHNDALQIYCAGREWRLRS